MNRNDDQEEVKQALRDARVDRYSALLADLNAANASLCLFKNGAGNLLIGTVVLPFVTIEGLAQLLAQLLDERRPQ